VQGCAIDQKGSLGALPFVACMSHGGATVDADAKACAEKSGFNYADLNGCYTGDKVCKWRHKPRSVVSKTGPSLPLPLTVPLGRNAYPLESCVCFAAGQVAHA
jgi:hypothetical protein